MISSCLNQHDFCHASLLAILSTANKKIFQLRLPEPEFQIDDRIRTERIWNDYVFPSYEGLDWEYGFVVRYFWQWNVWRLERFRRDWIYWVLFDKSNSEINSDRQRLDFVRHIEVIRE